MNYYYYYYYNELNYYYKQLNSNANITALTFGTKS